MAKRRNAEQVDRSGEATIVLRPARPADAARIAAIYAPHVAEGTATFEETPPDAAEMAQRLRRVMGRGYPWLVAEAGRDVIGYAYASGYHTRSAYRFTVEDSIYVDAAQQRRGVGRLLLQRLIEECRERGFRQMMAVIGDSANAASVGLHEALGFRQIGIARNIGFKFNRPLDVVFMQRELSEAADATGGRHAA